MISRSLSIVPKAFHRCIPSTLNRAAPNTCHRAVNTFNRVTSNSFPTGLSNFSTTRCLKDASNKHSYTNDSKNNSRSNMYVYGLLLGPAVLGVAGIRARKHLM
jgi:hypothetical protein